MAQQDRAQRTRTALVEAAAEMFDRHGFALASLSAISAHAGVSKGALHFHFANKDALARAVGAAAAQRLARITDRREDPGRGGALQLVIDATHDLARGLGEDAVLRVGFGVDRMPGPDGAADDSRQQVKAWVEQTLRRAADEGTTARGLPPEVVAATLVATVLGLGTLAARPGPAALTVLWDLLLPRLTADGAVGDLVAAGTAGTCRPDTEPGAAR
uniref:TetR/AcrR family transcriptional regulator n=1 Tax=Streptomyces sp. NBC_00003 TaxID=2903608 RepID=A0AAU2V629_9ACTN